MRLDARALMAPLAAIAIFALILTQTNEALRLSGAWRRAKAKADAAPNPFASLDQMLRLPPASADRPIRDPLRNSLAPAPVAATRGARTRLPVRPATPALPVLTSIVFDADPRATLRWNGRDYSVRSGALFADFRVTNITREQVVLDRSGESVVLRLPQRGENP